MGYHGINRAPFQTTHVPWNSMLYSVEVWCRQMKYHLVLWNSMELWDCHFIQCHATLDFHGIYHGIPWNSIEWSNKKSPNFMGFHGIRRAPLQMTQVFHGIPWNIPWNSKELWCRQVKYQVVPLNSMEFHGTLVSPNEVSLSSMEFHGTLRLPFYGILPWTSKGYSMEFHGTLESPNKKSLSSMRFHGIMRVPFQMTQVVHGIPWNIPWNSMELWYRQMKYSLVPWNSMEYSMEFHGTLVPPNDISLSSMEFHGTFRLSFYSMSCYPGIPWDILWNSVELYRVAK